MINGTAIYAVQGQNDWTESMQRAAAAGARFEICSRSISNHKFPEKTLPEWITPIWAAVPVIAEHVNEGFTYIRP